MDSYLKLMYSFSLNLKSYFGIILVKSDQTSDKVRERLERNIKTCSQCIPVFSGIFRYFQVKSGKPVNRTRSVIIVLVIRNWLTDKSSAQVWEMIAREGLAKTINGEKLIFQNLIIDQTSNSQFQRMKSCEKFYFQFYFLFRGFTVINGSSNPIIGSIKALVILVKVRSASYPLIWHVTCRMYE